MVACAAQHAPACRVLPCVLLSPVAMFFAWPPVSQDCLFTRKTGGCTGHGYMTEMMARHHATVCDETIMHPCCLIRSYILWFQVPNGRPAQLSMRLHVACCLVVGSRLWQCSLY